MYLRNHSQAVVTLDLKTTSQKFFPCQSQNSAKIKARREYSRAQRAEELTSAPFKDQLTAKGASKKKEHQE